MFSVFQLVDINSVLVWKTLGTLLLVRMDSVNRQLVLMIFVNLLPVRMTFVSALHRLGRITFVNSAVRQLLRMTFVNI